jgi:hypothetical protein
MAAVLRREGVPAAASVKAGKVGKPVGKSAGKNVPALVEWDKDELAAKVVAEVHSLLGG